MRSFPLAPMSPLIIVLTAVVLVIPLVFLLTGVGVGNGPLVWIGLVIAAGCLLVWLYARPDRFQVSPQGLAIIWPLRHRLIARSEIARVRPIDGRQFRQEFGWALRVGVGGLWGGFGWLWTRQGRVEFYVSRTDGLVLIERRSGRPLLITPARHDDFPGSPVRPRRPRPPLR